MTMTNTECPRFLFQRARVFLGGLACKVRVWQYSPLSIVFILNLLQRGCPCTALMRTPFCCRRIPHGVYESELWFAAITDGRCRALFFIMARSVVHDDDDNDRESGMISTSAIGVFSAVEDELMARVEQNVMIGPFVAIGGDDRLDEGHHVRAGQATLV